MNFYFQTSFFLAWVAFLLPLVTAAQFYTYDAAFAPSTQNFVRRGRGAAAVAGDFLYYDGGDIWQMVDGNFYGAPNNATLYIDLSSTWNNATVSFKTVNKTAQGDIGIWNRGYLWPDSGNTSIFQWGGEWSDLRLGTSTPPSVLDQLHLDDNGGGTWINRGATPDSLFDTLPRGVLGSISYRDEMMYLLGGYRDCQSDPSIDDCDKYDLLGPMISYNSTSNTWTKNSAANFSGSGSYLRGQMHNVPFGGPLGVNVIFGGYTARSAAAIADPSNLLGLDRIYIYDPETNTFWNQTATAATGVIPQQRVASCSVGVQGPNSTFEIFMYGGTDPTASADQDLALSDTIYVLSLPSFVWFQADITPLQRRWTHTCNIAGRGQSQMIVVGGVNETTVDGPGDTDPWTNGINVFDLSRMQWKDHYDPNANQYTTPKVVQDYLEKNGEYPQKWDYGYVENLFSKGTTSNPTNSSATDPLSTSSGKTSHSYTGAIVGGVVGGIAGLAIILGSGWFVQRSRRRKTAKLLLNQDKIESEPVTANHKYEDLDNWNEADSDQRYEMPTYPVGHELESQDSRLRQELP